MRAIHTKTQEEFNKVLEMFEKKWWKWPSWDNPTKLKGVWESYKEETCIDYENNFRYADRKFSEWYEIISFEQFLKEEEWIKEEEPTLPKELVINWLVYILKE